MGVLMKDILVYAMVAFMLAALGYGFYDFEVNPEKYTRKSKPPVKLGPGDKIIHRKDICYGTEQDTRTNTDSDVEASPRLAYTLC
jgi:hypothetical protein